MKERGDPRDSPGGDALLQANDEGSRIDRHYTPDFRTRSVQTGRRIARMSEACDARRNMGVGDLPGSAAARCVFPLGALGRREEGDARSVAYVAAGYYGSFWSRPVAGAQVIWSETCRAASGAVVRWRNRWREVLITGCLAGEGSGSVVVI